MARRRRRLWVVTMYSPFINQHVSYLSYGFEDDVRKGAKIYCAQLGFSGFEVKLYED